MVEIVGWFMVSHWWLLGSLKILRWILTFWLYVVLFLVYGGYSDMDWTLKQTLNELRGGFSNLCLV